MGHVEGDIPLDGFGRKLSPTIADLQEELFAVEGATQADRLPGGEAAFFSFGVDLVAARIAGRAIQGVFRSGADFSENAVAAAFRDDGCVE